eukprot:TRINITY_DN6295_c0_g1_i3.p1 TRINITY_DN6295_c0_g1~~TRINITY_DN6295_c0_g1_i3.p1  ORF type:complete len:437 (+),score=97.16 TRINITY_DN6295_c0_g1_i3:259-1569(+)
MLMKEIHPEPMLDMVMNGTPETDSITNYIEAIRALNEFQDKVRLTLEAYDEFVESYDKPGDPEEDFVRAQIQRGSPQSISMINWTDPPITIPNAETNPKSSFYIPVVQKSCESKGRTDLTPSLRKEAQSRWEAELLCEHYTSSPLTGSLTSFAVDESHARLTTPCGMYVHVMDINTGKWVAKRQSYDQSDLFVTDVKCQQIVGGGRGFVQLWDNDKSHTFKLNPDEEVMALAIEPLGNVVMCGGTSGTVQVWDIETGAVKIQCDWFSKDIYDIKVAQNLMAAASLDGSFRWVDMRLNAKKDISSQKYVTKNKIPLWSVAVNDRKVVAGSGDGRLFKHELRLGTTIDDSRVSHSGAIYGIHSDAHQFLTCGEDGIVRQEVAGKEKCWSFENTKAYAVWADQDCFLITDRDRIGMLTWRKGLSWTERESAVHTKRISK